VKLRSRRSQLLPTIVFLACNVGCRLQVPLQVSIPCRPLAKRTIGTLYIDIGIRPLGTTLRPSQRPKVSRGDKTRLQLDPKICQRNAPQALRRAMPRLAEKSLPARHKKNDRCSASSDIATSPNVPQQNRSLFRPRLLPLHWHNLAQILAWAKSTSFHEAV